MFQKIFTIEEAQALVPFMQETMGRLVYHWNRLELFRGEVERAAAAASSNGGTPVGASYIRALERIHGLRRGLAQRGVLVKDLSRGTCDLPAIRRGEIVLLCWQLGEERISWWHDREAGFAGRQPLEPEGDDV